VALAAYVLALSMILGPLVDLITTVLPARLGDVTWRYGFAGLAAGYLLTPLLGLALAIGVALWQEDLRLLRALGILALVAAGGLIPMLGMWGLDVLAVREMRDPDARSGVLVGGVIQGLKYLGALLALGLGGTGVTRTTGSLRGREAPTKAAGSPGSLRRE
jgi:hypothetical protein